MTKCSSTFELNISQSFLDSTKKKSVIQILGGKTFQADGTAWVRVLSYNTLNGDVEEGRDQGRDVIKSHVLAILGMY